MSAIDERTVDPAQPHPSSNMGHEMSDFSWTTVLWLLPISVIALIAFTLVCLFWFRGAKTEHVNIKETMFSTDELKIQRAKDAEFLGGYKYLDKAAGQVRIPIARAMELVVQEAQGKGRLDYKPITDTYLAGAAFARKVPGAAAEPAAAAAPETKAPEAKAPAAPAAKQPAQKAQEKKSESSAPGGGMGTDPKKAP